MKAGTEIWYRNPGVIIQRPLEFFPAKNAPLDRQLNASVRLVAYFSIIMTFVSRSPVYLKLTAVVLAATAAIYEMVGRGDREAFAVEGPRVPTRENPYMNALGVDGKAAFRGQAMQHVAEDVAPKPPGMNKRFDRFYTMPSTSNVPDSNGFAKWLFGSMPGKNGPITVATP